MAAMVVGLLTVPPDAHGQELLDGVRLYEQGDYAGAIAIWQPLAAQEDANALFNMGQVYRLGRGVEADVARARDYYERAAVQGHIAAQGYLGTLLYFGDENLRDVDKAIEWWQTAAANGDAGSQYMLGVLYFNGDHLKRDWVQAYAWMFLAVSNGLREAKDAEASMLQHLTPEQIAEAKALAPGLLVAPPPPPPLPSATLQASQPASAQPEPETPAVDDDPAPPPAPAPPPSGSQQWVLQLASLRDEEQAAATRAQLWRKHGDILGDMAYQTVEADLGDKGVFLRLLAGPVDDLEDARTRCARLRDQGQGCLVRRAP